jgi:hypothetical protein
MKYLLLGVGVFFSAIALDYAAAKYNQALHAHQRHRAARWGVATGALALVALASAFEVSLWYCIPEFVGSYIGICLAVPDGQPGNRDPGVPE